jgi:hypothetical protein
VDVARTETVSGFVDVVFARITEVRVDVITDVEVVVTVCVVVRLVIEVKTWVIGRMMTLVVVA